MMASIGRLALMVFWVLVMIASNGGCSSDSSSQQADITDVPDEVVNHIDVQPDLSAPDAADADDSLEPADESADAVGDAEEVADAVGDAEEVADAVGDAEDAEEVGDAGDAQSPPTPDLEPITATQAKELGAFVRTMTAAGEDSEPHPIAWSMINQACQDRAIVLQYGLSAADPFLQGQSPEMIQTDLNAEELLQLAAAPSFEAATINVAGPLVTFQTVLDPQGTPIPGDPLFWYWPYHHGVVVNVEGTLQVLDLSVGDAPLPIDTWLHAFVPNDIACVHSTAETHLEVWVYWNSAFSNFDPPPETPPILCSYTITPRFTFRWDQTMEGLMDFIISTPMTMNTQTAAFGTILDMEYGVAFDENELALILSQYTPGTAQDVCDRVPMKFCETLP